MAILGTYTDPSQLGDEVASSNALAGQTFGNYQPSTKDALALARIQQQMYSPYTHALFGAKNYGPTFDLSASNSWSDGLNKGLSNVMSGVNFRHQQADEQAVLNQQQQAMAAQTQQAQVAAQQQAQQEAAATDHIRQTQGEEAAFAYQQNPKKFSEAQGTAYGALPTVQTHALNTALGTGLGQGQAHLANVSANQEYLRGQGINPGDANRGQFTPQAINLIKDVTGNAPVDLLDFTERGYNAGQKKNEYQAGVVDNQYRGAMNNAKLTGETLNNQGKVTDNLLKKIELGFKEANERAALNEKYLTTQEKAASMARRDAAEQMIQTVGEQMRQGKQLTPADASRLDQTLKAANISTDFLGDLKSITNVKAGTPVTNDMVQKATGSNGFIILPSGMQYNPSTHAVINPATHHQSSTVSKPKVRAFDQASRFPAASMSAQHPDAGKPGPFWKLNDMLNTAVHGGGQIFDPFAGPPLPTLLPGRQ